MGETKALCRSRISWGELSGGWNAVYTSWGAGEREQKPCLGMGMVAVTEGTAAPDMDRWMQAPHTLLSGLCTPALPACVPG